MYKDNTIRISITGMETEGRVDILYSSAHLGGVMYVVSLLIPPFSSRLVNAALNPLLVVLVECCVGE